MAIISILGGSGFVATHIVPHLAKQGHVIRLCCRHPHQAAKLKLAGAVGQIVPMAINFKALSSLEPAIEGADIVINLVGILSSRDKSDYQALHVDAPAEAARLARLHGASAFIQMSALGANKAANSLYGASKAAGEDAVLKQFKNAVILRPSVLFGPQDDFINQFASIMTLSPVMPLVDGGTARFQPLYVGDLAKVVAKIVEMPEKYAGKIYELGGPEILSFKQIMENIAAACNRSIGFIPLNASISNMLAFFMGLAPQPKLNRDLLEMMRSDNVKKSKLPGIEAFDIAPATLQTIIPDYCDIYRKGGRFAPLQSKTS
ncbi:MAG: complex I NDUFA9 subunit family protein [Alphaproteobacteria bacterium]